jgi:hypothetical protein
MRRDMTDIHTGRWRGLCRDATPLESVGLQAPIPYHAYRWTQRGNQGRCGCISAIVQGDANYGGGTELDTEDNNFRGQA